MIVMVRWKVKLIRDCEVLVIAESEREESLEYIMIETATLLTLSKIFDGIPIQNLQTKQYVDKSKKISLWFTVKFRNQKNSREYIEAIKEFL